VIGLFVQLSRIIGVPRSYAELYALLFLSPRTLTMDEMIQRLGISKGSASQGLNFLRKAGAIRMAHQPGRRAAQYEAVAELRHLAAGFLQDQILPQVEDSQDRLDQIARMVAKLPAEERAHPCKVYNILGVAAPVLYIGPRPSHLSEMLDELDHEHPCAAVAHGEVDRAVQSIERLRRRRAALTRQTPARACSLFSKEVLLPRLVEELESA
jgi:DNA-binding transcriptional regulator GbsR (MarR family)